MQFVSAGHRRKPPSGVVVGVSEKKTGGKAGAVVVVIGAEVRLGVVDGDDVVGENTVELSVKFALVIFWDIEVADNDSVAELVVAMIAAVLLEEESVEPPLVNFWDDVDFGAVP